MEKKQFDQQDNSLPPSYQETVGATAPPAAPPSSSSSNAAYRDNFETDQDWLPEKTQPPQDTREDQPHAPLNETDNKLVNEALHFVENTPVPPSYQPRSHSLPRVIAIPQVSRGLDVPFMRAYSANLQNAGISCEQFMEFLDGLNAVTVSNPALKTASMAGMIAGSIPIVSIVSQPVIRGISHASSDSVYNSRIRKFITQANQRFFKPRGLVVSVKPTRELANNLGIQSSYEIMPKLQPRQMSMTVYERRLIPLQGRIEQLEYTHLPPVKPQSGSLASTASHVVQDKTCREIEMLYQQRIQYASQFPWFNNRLAKQVPIASTQWNRNQAGMGGYDDELSSNSSASGQYGNGSRREQLNDRYRELSRQLEYLHRAEVPDHVTIAELNQEMDEINRELRQPSVASTTPSGSSSGRTHPYQYNPSGGRGYYDNYDNHNDIYSNQRESRTGGGPLSLLTGMAVKGATKLYEKSRDYRDQREQRERFNRYNDPYSQAPQGQSTSSQAPQPHAPYGGQRRQQKLPSKAADFGEFYGDSSTGFNRDKEREAVLTMRWLVIENYL